MVDTMMESQENEHSDDEYIHQGNIQAQEYLSQVALQAQSLPDHFDAESPPPKRTRTHSAPKRGSSADFMHHLAQCTLDSPKDETVLPVNPLEWSRATLHAFGRLRDTVQDAYSRGVGSERRIAVPPLKDKEGWNSLMESQRPTVELLCQLDQVAIRKILVHVDLPHHSEWMYALLSRMDQGPLHRDQASLLRKMLQSLCRIRNETNNREVNVLIIIVGVFFGQSSGTEELMTVEAQI